MSNSFLASRSLSGIAEVRVQHCCQGMLSGKSIREIETLAPGSCFLCSLNILQPWESLLQAFSQVIWNTLPDRKSFSKLWVRQISLLKLFRSGRVFQMT